MQKFLQSSKSVQVSETYRLSVKRQVQEVALTQQQRAVLSTYDSPRASQVSPFQRLTDTPTRRFQGWRVP